MVYAPFMRHIPRTALPYPDRKMRPYNVRIGSRRTSVRLEPREWEILHLICQREGITVHAFCSEAASMRCERSQTARIRVAVLEYCLKGPVLPNKR